MDIMNDIKKIEEKVFKNFLECEDYYNFIKNSDKNSEIFLEVYNSITKIKNKKILDIKNIIIEVFDDKIEYSEFNLIKKKTNLIDFFLTIAIIKNFSKVSIFDIKTEKIRNIYNLGNNITIDLEKVIIYAEIKNNKKVKFDFNKMWNYVIKTILFLTEIKKIKSEIILINNKKNKFLSIDGLETDNSVILSFNNYEIWEKNNNYYLYSNHFSLTNKIFKENTKSGYFFKTNINSKLLENLKNNWIYIDKKRLKDIFIDFMDEIEIKENEIDYKYREIKEKIEAAIKKKDYSTLSLMSKKLSFFQNIIKIRYILEMKIDDKKIYLPFVFDFRGRLYYDSPISPTFYKEFRYCINWGKYSNFETNEHIYNDIINNEIKKHLNEIKKIKKYKLENKNINVKISIIWLLISLAEINKSKIGKKVSIEEFIKEGINIINDEGYENYDLEDKIKIKFIKNILEEISNDIYKKWLISKDATASVYQHLIKTCGSTSENVLEWCNLKSTNTWFDTYSYIIENFLEDYKVKNKKIKEILNRKTLKKTIMTENYSASLKTCKKYFLEEIEIYKFNSIEKEEITEIFEKFYSYISNNKLMFKNDINNIIEILEKNDYIIYINNEENDVVVLKYYKGMKKQKEIIVNKKRYTYQEYSINKKIKDIKKIKTSLKANYVHAMDASLVRWFLSHNKALAVHDCFFIDYLNLSYLVSCINEGMRISFHNINEINTSLIFSIFIVL